MTAAFGRDGRAALPVCRARWPHLRDYDEEAWPKLKEAPSLEILKAFRLIGQLPTLSSYADEEIWEATETHRNAGTAQQAATGSLRAPEWEVFTTPDPARNSTDFRLKPVNA